jgi:hypothetical protein
VCGTTRLAFLGQLELPPKARELAELADRLEALSASLAQEPARRRMSAPSRARAPITVQ